MTDYMTLKSDFDATLDDALSGVYNDANEALRRMYAAALARAETAEVERALWRLRHRAIYDKYDGTRDERESLIARVDELEEAQQWRPGTAKPPGPAWYFVYDLREDDTPLRRYHRDDNRYGQVL